MKQISLCFYIALFVIVQTVNSAPTKPEEQPAETATAAEPAAKEPAATPASPRKRDQLKSALSGASKDLVDSAKELNNLPEEERKAKGGFRRALSSKFTEHIMDKGLKALESHPTFGASVPLIRTFAPTIRDGVADGVVSLTNKLKKKKPNDEKEAGEAKKKEAEKENVKDRELEPKLVSASPDKKEASKKSEDKKKASEMSDDEKHEAESSESESESESDTETSNDESKEEPKGENKKNKSGENESESKQNKATKKGH